MVEEAPVETFRTVSAIAVVCLPSSVDGRI
jgi:hypothetical protein